MHIIHIIYLSKTCLLDLCVLSFWRLLYLFKAAGSACVASQAATGSTHGTDLRRFSRVIGGTTGRKSEEVISLTIEKQAIYGGFHKCGYPKWLVYN